MFTLYPYNDFPDFPTKSEMGLARGVFTSHLRENVYSLWTIMDSLYFSKQEEMKFTYLLLYSRFLGLKFYFQAYF